jgi:hypothetical protein
MIDHHDDNCGDKNKNSGCQQTVFGELDVSTDRSELQSFYSQAHRRRQSFSSVLSRSEFFGSVRSDNFTSMSSIYSTTMLSSGSFISVNSDGLASISGPLSKTMTSALSFPAASDHSMQSSIEGLISCPRWIECGSSSSEQNPCPSLEVQSCEQTKTVAVVLDGPIDLSSLLDRCDGDIQLVNGVLHSFCEQGQHHLASIQSITDAAHDNENQVMSFHAVNVHQTRFHLLPFSFLFCFLRSIDLQSRFC